MNIAFRIIAVFLCATIGVFVILQLFPGDVVTKRYASLTDARADQLFERGWLPDILPPSTHNICTSNNLDLSVSTGQFSFTPLEYSSFATHLKPYEPISTPFSDFEEEVARNRRSGFQVSLYFEDQVTWVFFCKQQAGYCEYTMWLSNG